MVISPLLARLCPSDATLFNLRQMPIECQLNEIIHATEHKRSNVCSRINNTTYPCTSVQITGTPHPSTTTHALARCAHAFVHMLRTYTHAQYTHHLSVTLAPRVVEPYGFYAKLSRVKSPSPGTPMHGPIIHARERRLRNKHSDPERRAHTKAFARYCHDKAKSHAHSHTYRRILIYIVLFDNDYSDILYSPTCHCRCCHVPRSPIG